MRERPKTVNPRNSANPAKSPDTAQGITLRPVVLAADQDFLLQVYASTRAHEMSLVPWTDAQKQAFVRQQFEAQLAHYAMQYPEANHGLIHKQGTPVGRLYLARGPEVLHILDITILPARRNTGIGSHVMGELLREAKQAKKRVTIYVESFNPSLRLFERLGFRKVEENGFQFLMEWKA